MNHLTNKSTSDISTEIVNFVLGDTIQGPLSGVLANKIKAALDAERKSREERLIREAVKEIISHAHCGSCECCDEQSLNDEEATDAILALFNDGAKEKP